MKTVHSACLQFLRSYFGAKDSTSGDCKLGLRLICLGNPEKTVQGELLYFLRAKGFFAVSECGLYDKKSRRSLDITIFDKKWQPKCVIELKHFSRNQGSISRLVTALKMDLEKHESKPGQEVPIIQIGLYSEILRVVAPFEKNEKVLHQFGLYRFLKSYCDNSLNEMDALDNTGDYVFISPKINFIAIDQHKRITGRVHYCCKSVE